MRSLLPDLSDVSIVVLSHNRRDVIGRNLTSLLELALDTNCELIVVDNASSDGSAEIFKDLLRGHSSARFIASAVNLGVAAGRNLGWRAATREYILNIDDDTIITGDAVETLLVALRNRPELGIVSPRILQATTGAPQLSFPEVERALSNFHGACHMIRGSLVGAAGYNDEDCTFGGEELDLSIRARAAGFEVTYVGGATVLHESLPRSGTVARDRRLRWLYNFTRVFHKHFPPSLALPLTSRYLVAQLASGVGAFGILFAAALIDAAWRGARDGRRIHRSVPKQVIACYRDSNLRPEFGNVPLLRKLLRRWLA